MPVQLADSDTDTIGPYARLSASQFNTYKACPRLWYYEKVLRFKMPQIPVLFVGRAVEETICRVLRESPGLIIGEAPVETYGQPPLDDEGRPTREDGRSWPASILLPLDESMIPDNPHDLREWTLTRAEHHFPLVFERCRKEWEKDERKAGDWLDVEEEEVLRMVFEGLTFHLREVERCFEAGGGPHLGQWRSGKREEWPAPDGYQQTDFARHHPLAAEGDVTWLEAWEISRPWFVHPDAKPFTMNAIHPEHWLQGEYDLVYRWDGDITIVDLKASVGANDRSGDYVEQLRMYAMLWYVTHGRTSQVKSLQIWYLGHASIKEIPCPSVDEMDEMERELKSLWSELKQEKPAREDCQPAPAPMRGFAPGGKPAAPPNMSRCDRCDWKAMCPNGSGTDEEVLPSRLQLPGSLDVTMLEEIGHLNARATVRGELFSVGLIREKSPLKMVLKQDEYFAQLYFVSNEHHLGGSTWHSLPKKGQNVLVEDAIFTVNWKGEIVLKFDPFARLSLDESPETESFHLMDYQAKHSVGGKVVYTYLKSGVGRNGKVWRRRGMMLLDHTGAMKIEGWADDWNAQFEMVEVGDDVVVTNIGLDAWATEVRGDYTRNSRLQIINRVDRSAA